MEDDDDDNNTINPFSQEEEPILKIILLDGKELTIQQYNSHHDLWGINSTVWSGGLALLRTLSDRFSSPHKTRTTMPETTCLLDLGSGTGIVGLGLSAVTRGRMKTIVTDLPQALPLLEINRDENKSFWSQTEQHCSIAASPPTVRQLSWGDTIIHDYCVDGRQNLIITGADVVYRPSLFAPLLCTLKELWHRTRLCGGAVEILLACQSIRTHLNDFWEFSRREGFRLCLVSVVDVRAVCSSGYRKLDLDKIEVLNVNGVLPSVQFPPQDGRIYIVKLVIKDDGRGDV